MNRYSKTINKLYKADENYTCYYKASVSGLYIYPIAHKFESRGYIKLTDLIVPNKETDML